MTLLMGGKYTNDMPEKCGYNDFQGENDTII